MQRPLGDDGPAEFPFVSTGHVSAMDLAVMGATLADGGLNPLTKKRVVDTQVCHYVLAVMVTAALYETPAICSACQARAGLAAAS